MLLAFAAFICLIIPAWAQSAITKSLPGHVPLIVKRLTPTGVPPASQSLRLAVALPLRNQVALTNFLQQLYDPTSPNYHHYLTPGQFTQQFGPSAEDYQAVMRFATNNGLTVAMTHGSRILIDLKGKVSDVENAFHVTLRTYQHPSEARQFFAPDSDPLVDASLPVVGIEGLNNYSRLGTASHKHRKDLNSAPAAGSAPGGTYMGNDFRRAYVPDVALTGAGQMVGLFEADGYHTSDILTYEKLAGLPNVSLINVTNDGFDGLPGQYNSEVTLDIEMAISMAPGLDAVVVFEGPNEINDWLDILDNMSSSNQIKQFSSSWGYIQAPNPNASFDSVFMKMAAQGQSFFQASGDGDAWVSPIWVPAASPFLTSVGGTTLYMTGSGGGYAADTVWNLGDLGTNNAWFAGGDGYWGSGGGVSPSYAIPSWQQSVGMVGNNGSTALRNIPDVALTANNIWVTYDGGSAAGFYGTSCAAPLWAGFAALVNQQAAANGLPGVGFINPAIYSIGTGANYTNCFHDVTNGNNTSAGSPSLFSAVPGYDLCTGWGTPAGQPLIDALAPDALGIAPSTGLFASGLAGGPFTNSSLTFFLTNRSGSNLAWKCANISPWLSLSSTTGTLFPGQSATVTIGLNSLASNLIPGTYTAEIWFTNISSGIAQGRQNVLLAKQTRVGGACATTLLSFQPVAYWQLNETNVLPSANVITNGGSLGYVGNGFPFDNVLQGQTGIVSNCVSFSNPELGVIFLGSYIDIPYNQILNPSGPFTVEFWAKPNQTPTDFFCPVSSIDDTQNNNASRFGWVFYEAAGNQWVFRLGNLNGYVATLTGGTVFTNVWQYVAGVYDGTNVTLYVNGALVAGPVSAIGYFPNTNQAVTLRLGATSFGNRTFDGSVDEVAVYTNSLSANTIFIHYQAAMTNNPGYGNQILAAKPVGYWRLDEPVYAVPAANALPTAFNFGSLADMADGTYQPSSVPGVAGMSGAGFGSSNRACAFAANSCVDIPGTWLNITGPLTLSAWVKTPATSGLNECVISKGAASYQLSINGSGCPQFTDGAQPFGNLVATNRVDDNQWHHLAGVYDGTNSEYLYIDGQIAVASTNATDFPPPNGNDLFIGGDPDFGVLQFFNGIIDEVAIFTNALSADQIIWLFSTGYNVTLLKASVTSASSGTITLTWSAIPGQKYQMEYSTNLTQNNWSVLGGPTIATNSMLSLSDMTGSAAQRFYRVVLLP